MNELFSRIHDIVLTLASVDWNNLGSVGKLLQKFETTQSLASKPGKEAFSQPLKNMVNLLESFILGEYKDKAKAIVTIEKAVETLQEMADSDGVKKKQSAGLSADQQNELREYATGALGLIEELEQRILDLEKESLNKNLINEIFRIVHTLKGETGFTALRGVAELLHHFESVFSVLRETPVVIDKKAADLLLNIVDILKKTFNLCGKEPDLAASQFFTAQGEMLLHLKEGIQALQAAPANTMQTGPSSAPKQEIERIDLAQIEDVSLYTDFIHETHEHLEQIEVKVLELETRLDDADVLNELFRHLHTIKGISGFLSLQHINQVSHNAENFLDLARSGKLPMDREGIDLVFEIVDMLRRLTGLLDLQVKGKGFPDDDYPWVEALFRKIHNLINAKQQAPAKSAPNASLPMEKKVGEILVAEKVVSEKDVAEALLLQTGKGAGKKIGQILIEQDKVTPKEISDALRRQLDSVSKGETSAVKVATEKLDHLIDTVGELVISQTLIAQHPFVVAGCEPALSKNVAHQTKIVRDIQWVSLTLRMVPVRQTFQKMARLVRDLSMKSGKKIDLVISGAETELDKNMVEQINDPLVHMIRNSVDHGIESPEERVQAGKTALGRVFLNAYHQGGNIVLEVKDDGKGLDRDAIRKKAVEKGLIAPDANLEEQELFNLVFQPGFSTAQKVTDVSGRGVGMDVVKKNIEKLGGNVTIASESGKGSLIVIRLPLTMAILDGMILQVGNERYLLPVIAIKESIQPSRKDITTIQGKGEMVNVRGALIPIIRLHRLFRETSECRNPWEAIIIIVENAGKPYGMMVDNILGQQQVVIKSLKGEFRNIKGISGCSILGDGRVGLILDIKGLVEIAVE
ncbi:MAG: chemotaxis protein CheA [Fibrobacterota bacterium]